ncbi:unnamed protein product [Rhizophagus irregularis]|nr:unnamed protein product [Rhizophagus irregularis]
MYCEYYLIHYLLLSFTLSRYPDVKKENIERIFQDDKTRLVTYNLTYREAIEVINGPAETIIRINIDAIHNNEEYWEELNKFNPDKWMVKGFEPKKNSFIIFGGGLRVCPGRKLSKIELILN